MQQHCIKKLKKAEEQLADSEELEKNEEELKIQVQKLEHRLEELKKVKSEELKLTAVIVLCLFLGKSLNQYLQEGASKVGFQKSCKADTVDRA